MGACVCRTYTQPAQSSYCGEIKAYSSLETTNSARELETGALELTARCIARYGRWAWSFEY